MVEHKHLTEALYFDAQLQSAAEGLSGGIVIMWKEDLLKLDNISIIKQGIHVHIKVCPTPDSWLFFAIYASPDLETRKSLWTELIDIGKNYPMDWLLGGDFNEVLNAQEKLEGNNIVNARVKLFWKCIQNCNLIDLGYEGPKFT